MKKPYMIPEAIAICLAAALPLATSQPDVNISPGVTPVPGSELDAKESKSVWDEEW